MCCSHQGLVPAFLPPFFFSPSYSLSFFLELGAKESFMLVLSLDLLSGVMRSGIGFTGWIPPYGSHMGTLRFLISAVAVWTGPIPGSLRWYLPAPGLLVDDLSS